VSNKKPSQNSQHDNPGPRLLYDRAEAARQLSVSIRTIDYFLAAGKFRTRRIGKKVLIPHQELVRFAAQDHWQAVDSQADSVA
jgi:excisionase family DNA binding protein